MKKTFIIAALLIVPILATANGSNLVVGCSMLIEEIENGNDNITAPMPVYCMAYIQGISDLNKFYEASSINTPYFCIPETEGMINRARTIIEYLKKHQELVEQQPGLIAFQAYRDGYPCQK